MRSPRTSSARGHAGRPNVLFVFADQLRASALGQAGSENVLTPNLDRFSAQSMVLTRAIANTPVCSPARASILTGLHTLTHGVVFNDIQLRTDVVSLAHCLGQAGYRCGYIGKWHLDCADRGVFVPPGPRRQGFDDYWASSNCNHRYFQAYYYLDDPEPVWIQGYEPDEQTRLAIRYMRSRAHREEPFCLFLSWGPPHCPYREAPRDCLELYPPPEIQLRPNAPEHADRSTIAGYYAHVTALDRCFGSLMRALAEIGIQDDTIVIFTSDHGDMLWSHDRGWKCKPWMESIGIPFIARWPGRIPARSSRALLGLVDIMPSLLSLMGIEPPSAVQGTDLSAVLLGDESASPHSAFINLPVAPYRYSFREWRGVVTATHTYARCRDEPWVLYDDVRDPCQMHNLALDPGRGELRNELEEELQGWLRRTGDAFPGTEEVARAHYPGAVDGEMPYYENEVIRAGKASRQAARDPEGGESPGL